jgi:hypothetical protein
MSLWPYLIIHGFLPYKDIAIAHTPFMLVFLSIFYKLFGVGIFQLQIFTWISILVFDVFFFWVVQKLWNRKIALIALIVFVIWQLFFEGNGLWFDLCMGMWMFASFYFLRIKKWFIAGILFALAVFTKQTAVWFLIPIGYTMVGEVVHGINGINGINGKWPIVKNILRRPLKTWSCKVLDKFVLGSFVIIFPFILALTVFGILTNFWDWAINFGIFVLPKAGGQIQLPDLKNLAFAGIPFVVFIPFLFSRKIRDVNLLLWAFAGTLGAYPRFEYFHFQPAIPYLAIASSLVFTNINRKNILTRVFTVFYVLACLYLLFIFFIRNYDEGVRFYEQDVQDVATYIKENTQPGEKIFVINWWDSLYALTDTLPATDPWMPQLSWYQEIPGVQEKEVTNLSISKPAMIILQPYTESGLSSYIPQKVYDYVVANYDLKTKIDEIEILVPKK